MIELPDGLKKINANPAGKLIDCSEAALLEFKDKISDKFWGAIPDVDGVVVFWGRNGRRPQQSQKISPSEARSRIQEKLAKGYKPSANPEKLQLAFEKAPEWFDNLRVASPAFKFMVERAKIALALAISPDNAPAESKKRAAFRL